MKRIKILHFIDSLRAGGKERQLVELLKGLSAYKEIVCELAIMSEDIQYDAVNNLDIQKHYLIRKNKKDPRILVKLYKLCKEFKPDIIHSWDSMTSVYAVPVAKMLGIKLINGMIRDSSPFKLFSKSCIRSKITFPFSDVILANSNAGLKAYNAPMHKSACIYNGFDFNRIRNLQDENTVRRKFNIDTEKVVGMVATFSDNKDYETYILAAKMILEKRNNVTFLAIGGGENLEKCKKMAEGGFRVKIIFPGSQEDVESIINIFDVGVLSTNIKIHREGISNSIMEYMALGKPVVATDGGGTGEIVVDKQTGYLVPFVSPDILANKVEYLLEHHETAKQMGNAGKKRLSEVFSLDRMTKKFAELYEVVLRD